MHASIPPCVPAMGLGLVVAIVAALVGSLPWLALGTFALACGAIDGLRMTGVRFGRLASDALDCLLLIAVFLVLCLFKPFASDAPHELE